MAAIVEFEQMEWNFRLKARISRTDPDKSAQGSLVLGRKVESGTLYPDLSLLPAVDNTPGILKIHPMYIEKMITIVLGYSNTKKVIRTIKIDRT